LLSSVVALREQLVVVKGEETVETVRSFTLASITRLKPGVNEMNAGKYAQVREVTHTLPVHRLHLPATSRN
jgi:hypothetical protein